MHFLRSMKYNTGLAKRDASKEAKNEKAYRPTPYLTGTHSSNCRFCSGPKRTSKTAGPQPTRIHHREFPHRKWSDSTAGASGIRNIWPVECRQRQCCAVAVALHGESPWL